MKNNTEEQRKQAMVLLHKSGLEGAIAAGYNISCLKDAGKNLKGVNKNIYALLWYNTVKKDGTVSGVAVFIDNDTKKMKLSEVDSEFKLVYERVNIAFAPSLMAAYAAGAKHYKQSFSNLVKNTETSNFAKAMISYQYFQGSFWKPKDLKKAFEWAEKAVEKGNDASCQIWLSLLYYYSNGSYKNLEKSYMWAYIASKNNTETGILIMRALKKEMKPVDTAVAVNEAEKWLSGHIN